MTHLITWFGRKTLDFFSAVGSVFVLLGRSIGNVHYVHADRVLYIEQLYRLGVRAIPLATIIAIFAGAVAGWQGAYQLKGTLPMRFLGQIVAGGILMEMGPVLTAIVLAGRNGSSIAAELATMVVTEQVDAIQAMGLNPIRHLVTPRVMAMIIMLPLLTMWADFVAIFSGFFISNYFFNLNFSTFFNGFQATFDNQSYFYPGLFKSIMFGISTGVVSCWVGLRASWGATGVGRAAIDAFVFSSTLMLINDYIVATLLF